MEHALLLVNPHARRGQANLETAKRILSDLGMQLLPAFPDHPHQISELIRQYRGQVDRVIIGGGDGTLNAAAAGLVDTQLPLGILPLGTANDLARTLGIPTNLPEACRVISQGKVRPIDLGWVNGYYFFNVASLGLSVQITQKLSKEIKRRWGVLAYGLTALQVLWQSRLFQAEIEIHGRYSSVRTVQIAVGNGRYYGGGMAVAVDAAIDDQRLDLYSLELEHWWQILAVLPAMRQGKHATWPGVQAFQGQDIYIHTRRPQPINIDGEIRTSTPAHFRVIPQAMPVIAPA